ncbi:MAG: PspA/IM30 family protein [Candidatus Korarchaeum sp.]|nr:PspA/IM30 family protein [Candidatus Korarchaeum sp.]MDW8036024.1 PspA/IM30 family protein [Candidatus Korarchaeum sp.]
MSGFWDRLRVNIEAKLSKLLDRFEDPREQLDYAYDKLVQQLHNVEIALSRAIAARKKLEFELERLDDKIKDMDEKAKRALKVGREDLAKQALERKLVLSQQRSVLEKRINDMKEDEEKLLAVRDNLKTKIDLFKAKKEQLKAEYEASKAQVEVQGMVTGLSEDFTSAARIIERSEEKVNEMKARAAALDELIATGGALDLLEPEEKDVIERELGKIELQTQLEEELKRLKEEVGG